MVQASAPISSVKQATTDFFETLEAKRKPSLFPQLSLDELEKRAQRHFHESIIAKKLIQPLFDRLAALLDSDRFDAQQVIEVREKIAAAIPMPRSWWTRVLFQKPRLACKIEGSFWQVELGAKGYSQEVVDKLTIYLRKRGFLPCESIHQADQLTKEPLELRSEVVQMMGDRNSMEDVAKVIELPNGVLSVVADGHKDNSLLATAQTEAFIEVFRSRVASLDKVTVQDMLWAWEISVKTTEKKALPIFEKYFPDLIPDSESEEERMQIWKSYLQEGRISYEALMNLDLTAKESGLLRGGTVFGATFVSRSGQVLGVFQGDIHAFALRNGKFVPLSCSADFRSLREQEVLETLLSSHDQYESGQVASREDFLTAVTPDASLVESPKEVCDGQLLVTQLPSNKINVTEDVAREWCYWPERKARDSSPPHIFLQGSGLVHYTNVSGATGVPWLVALTKGAFPLCRARTLFVESMKQGDAVFIGSDGFDLQAKEIKLMAQKIKDPSALLKALASAAIDLPLEDSYLAFTSLAPKRSASESIGMWQRALDEWIVQMAENSERAQLLEPFCHALPYPFLFEDERLWKEAVIEKIPRLYKMASLESDLPSVIKARDFLKHFERTTIEELTPENFSEYLGFFPLGLGLEGNQEWLRESKRSINWWSKTARHDNLTLCGTFVL